MYTIKVSQPPLGWDNIRDENGDTVFWPSFKKAQDYGRMFVDESPATQDWYVEKAVEEEPPNIQK